MSRSALLPSFHWYRRVTRRSVAFPRYGRYPRPGVARSGFFVFWDEFGSDGRAELERLVGLVVDRGYVEGVEEVDAEFVIFRIGLGRPTRSSCDNQGIRSCPPSARNPGRGRHRWPPLARLDPRGRRRTRGLRPRSPASWKRHAPRLDLFAVGQFKAEASEVAIGRVNPYADTWSETQDLADPGVLANLMRVDNPAHPADLVVSAIGDDTMEGLVSEVAVRTGSAPVLFARTLHDGDLVRVMLLRPGRDDACLECLRLHADDGHPGFIDAPDSDLPPVFDAGCATAAQPGAGLASRQAAIFAAKRALAVLLKTDGEQNHWLWVDHAIPSAPDARLHVAETMHAARLPRHPDCSFCA